jgi:hypothetical protein
MKRILSAIGLLAMVLAVCSPPAFAQSTKKPADVTFNGRETWLQNIRWCWNAGTTTIADIGLERSAAGVLSVTDCNGTVKRIKASYFTATSDVVVGYSGSGAPTDGTSGTLAGIAGPGSLYHRTSNGAVYANTNTKASPTWTQLGSVAALTSAHIFVGNGSNAGTDVAVSGDLTLANTGAFTVATVGTATAVEIGKLAGVTAGTTTASKALVVDANKALDALNVVALSLGAGAGTAVTATAAELNKNAGVTAGTAAASKVVVLDANTAIGGLKVAYGGATTTTAGPGPATSLVDATSTAAGTTQSMFYTVNSVVVKASAFNAATRGVQCDAWGTTAANANAKDIKITIGSATLATVVGSTANAKAYNAHFTVLRSGSNTQSGVGSIQIDTAVAPTMAQSTALGQTEGSDITIAVQGQNTAAAASSITGNGMVCTFLN